MSKLQEVADALAELTYAEMVELADAVSDTLTSTMGNGSQEVRMAVALNAFAHAYAEKEET